jgi:hypothetical protein
VYHPAVRTEGLLLRQGRLPLGFKRYPVLPNSMHWVVTEMAPTPPSALNIANGAVEQVQ